MRPFFEGKSAAPPCLISDRIKKSSQRYIKTVKIRLYFSKHAKLKRLDAIEAHVFREKE